jgi:hypothetical protein
MEKANPMLQTNNQKLRSGMKKLSALLGMCALLSMSGCSAYKLAKAVTTDKPVGNRIQVSKDDLDDYKKRNGFDKPATTQPAAPNSAVATQPSQATKTVEKHAAESALDAVFTDGVDVNERIMAVSIGDAKALVEATPAEVGRAYDNVVRLRAKDGKQVIMTKEWYVANAAAATTVKIVDSVWTKNISAHALVSTSMKKLVRFANSNALIAETGDLVAVGAFEDRGAWIIKILCQKSSPDFEKCAGKYSRGMFQATDGREISIADFKLVEGGKRINPSTYEKVSSIE